MPALWMHSSRRKIRLEQAEALLAEGLANREESFLQTIRKGIFEVPRSPYLALFRWAGVEWGDVERLVRNEGVEGSLQALNTAGVRVTLDEFKGKRPIQRPGLELPVTAEDFDSPLLNVHFEGRTGGSGGVRRRLLVDLGLIAHDAAAFRIVLESLGATRMPSATWRAVPPNNSGLKKPLMGARIGIPLDRWFSELPTRWDPPNFKYAAFTAYTVLAARHAGCRFPYPEHVTREEVGIIVDWMAEMVAAGTPAYMDCAASAAVRICQSALDSGADLRGSLFRAGSEPLTRARAEIIRRTGSRVVAGFSTSETGPIGMACAEAAAPDDVHVFTDKIAVIHGTSETDAPGREDVLLMTTIFPACPKILLNVDSGDSGILETRDCSCGLGRLGFNLHLRQIHSHEKLTSEGILLSPAEICRLVEEVLPAAFGGAPTDYQLIEDGHDGIPVIRIAIRPEVGPLDEPTVVRTLLTAMSRAGAGGSLMAQQLEQAGTVSVIRQEPHRSPIGKMNPLFVVPKE